MPDVEQFLVDLSSGAPIPGGGSVAALQAAMGASLLAMVANLTMGKKRYASVQPQVEAVRTEAEHLRDHAFRLIEEDSDAYNGVAQVFAMPRETGEQKEARAAAMQDALRGAVEPPLATARVAARIAELAQELVPIGNPSAVSDVGTACLSARAGFWAAVLNVEINLASIQDPDYVSARREALAALPDVDAIERAVVMETERVIQGKT